MQRKKLTLQLASMLSKKSLKPDHTYVPSLRLGTSTTHARMFQAMIPSAIKYNLRINSELDGKDHAKITIHLLKKSRTVLLVSRHSMIQSIAKSRSVLSILPGERMISIASG